MTSRHYERSWSIEPQPWSARSDEECVTVEPPMRDKALQLSAHRKQAGDWEPEEMARLAAERAAGAHAQSTQCGAFAGMTAAHRNEHTGSWWRQWWLASGPMLLYVTYIA